MQVTLACKVREGSQKVTGWKRPRGHPPTIPGFVKLTRTAALLQQKLCSWWLTVQDGDRTLRLSRLRITDDDNEVTYKYTI